LRLSRPIQPSEQPRGWLIGPLIVDFQHKTAAANHPDKRFALAEAYTVFLLINPSK